MGLTSRPRRPHPTDAHRPGRLSLDVARPVTLTPPVGAAPSLPRRRGRSIPSEDVAGPKVGN